MDDVVDANEDEATVFQALPSNDFDPDGDILTMALNQPFSQAGRSLSLQPGGVISVPPIDFHGNDYFIDTVSDGKGKRAQATVSIDLTNLNDDPHGIQDFVQTESSTPILIADLLLNDSDIDNNDALSIFSVDAVSEAGGHIYSVNAYSVLYTPTDDFVGVDYFEYTVSDNDKGLSTVRVTVNVVETAQYSGACKLNNVTSDSNSGSLSWHMSLCAQGGRSNHILVEYANIIRIGLNQISIDNSYQHVICHNDTNSALSTIRPIN